MMEDIRNHDALPTAEECAWMEVDGIGAVLRACALAAVALVVGLGAAALLEDADASRNVVIFAPR
jgi:hypothetical protein